MGWRAAAAPTQAQLWEPRWQQGRAIVWRRSIHHGEFQSNGRGGKLAALKIYKREEKQIKFKKNKINAAVDDNLNQGWVKRMGCSRFW